MTVPSWLKKPPAHLSESAASVWKAYARRLFREERLDADNAVKFGGLCELMALEIQTLAEIRTNGVSIGTAAGGKKSNPAAIFYLQLLKASAELKGDFGLG